MGLETLNAMISDPITPSPDQEVSARPHRAHVQSFHFVEPQYGRQRRGQERRDIRSFVMQKARREKPWSTSKRVKHASYKGRAGESIELGPSSTGNLLPSRTLSKKGKLGEAMEDSLEPENPETQSDQVLGWPMDSNEMQWHVHSPQLGIHMPHAGDSVGNGVLDPFATYPIDLDARSLGLVEHYISVLAHEAIPVDVRRQSNVLKTQWFALAMTHRAFMHSLLATAAMHAYTVGKASYYDIIRHKSLAVQEINLNLSDPISRIDDGNIAAVFSLLCVEESMLLPFIAQDGESQDLASSQRLVHVNGLKRMIELRGGLAGLRVNQCLQALIIWHVALHSVASFYPPYLPLPESSHKNSQPQRQSPYNDRPTAPSQILTCCFDLGVDQDLAILLDDLSFLTTQLAHWLNDPQAPFEPVDLQTRGNMIQVRLLGKYSNIQTASLPSPMQSTLCLAALVFTVLVFQSRHELGIQALHHTALDQLTQNLILTQDYEWERVPDLKLWVLVIGAIGARGSAELPWFLNMLSSFCLDQRLTKTDEVIQRIRPLFWIDEQLNGVLMQLWHHSLS
ncbi:hypothetical protein EV356DRAFT_514665 [Viridothelium virens]|uniref:Transcription factor domain-containing protein n=1 Tax=Viridothelium virens TaxID=1048519 RepID=A0A6A6HA72_VIRVR|nr:hypothetical protein EV356DRAFT_514665 [Viridothelium virens]